MIPSDMARWVGAAPTWLKQYFANNETTNPGAEATLAQTDPLEPGCYDVFLSATTNCALGTGMLSCEWRNAAGTGNIIFFAFAAVSQLCWTLALLGVKVATNERFRFFSTAGFTGVVGTSIVAVRRTP